MKAYHFIKFAARKYFSELVLFSQDEDVHYLILTDFAVFYAKFEFIFTMIRPKRWFSFRKFYALAPLKNFVPLCKHNVNEFKTSSTRALVSCIQSVFQNPNDFPRKMWTEWKRTTAGWTLYVYIHPAKKVFEHLRYFVSKNLY